MQVSLQLRNFSSIIDCLFCHIPHPLSQILSISWFLSLCVFALCFELCLIFQDANSDINIDTFLLQFISWNFCIKIFFFGLRKSGFFVCAALKSPFLIFLVQVIYASSYFCTEGSARNSSPWLLGPLGIFFSFVCSLGLCSSYWGIFGGSIPKAEEEIGTAPLAQA